MRTLPLMQQRRMLAMVCIGLTKADICREMRLKPYQLEWHLQHLYERMGIPQHAVNARVLLAVAALQQGEVDLKTLNPVEAAPCPLTK